MHPIFFGPLQKHTTIKAIFKNTTIKTGFTTHPLDLGLMWKPWKSRDSPATHIKWWSQTTPFIVLEILEMPIEMLGFLKSPHIIWAFLKHHTLLDHGVRVMVVIPLGWCDGWLISIYPACDTPRVTCLVVWARTNCQVCNVKSKNHWWELHLIQRIQISLTCTYCVYIWHLACTKLHFVAWYVITMVR